MKSALKFLSGSFATYVLMAACSSVSAPSATRPAGAGGGAMLATGGVPGVAADGSSGSNAQQSGSGGSMMGAITDPVPDAAAEPATDGTRLKAEYNVGDDGSRQFAGWWDSARSEECSFLAFTDGSMRCVPSGGASTGTYFSDSGCVSALFVSVPSVCAGGAKYALGAATFSGCGTASYDGIYSLAVGSPSQVFQGKPGACTMASATLLATFTFYTGTPIPLSSFVGATKQHG